MREVPPCPNHACVAHKRRAFQNSKHGSLSDHVIGIDCQNLDFFVKMLTPWKCLLSGSGEKVQLEWENCSEMDEWRCAWRWVSQIARISKSRSISCFLLAALLRPPAFWFICDSFHERVPPLPCMRCMRRFHCFELKHQTKETRDRLASWLWNPGLDQFLLSLVSWQAAQ